MLALVFRNRLQVLLKLEPNSSFPLDFLLELSSFSFLLKSNLFLFSDFLAFLDTLQVLSPLLLSELTSGFFLLYDGLFVDFFALFPSFESALRFAVLDDHKQDEGDIEEQNCTEED